jgi:steroid delta-isomerase-like uncharacterized protein
MRWLPPNLDAIGPFSRPGTMTPTEALVRRYYDAFNRGDTEDMLACVADDVIHDLNQGERRLGKERFRAFCARMAHHYKEELREIAVMGSADGARAAAEFNVHGGPIWPAKRACPRPRASAMSCPPARSSPSATAKIVRVTTYYNLTDWIMQVSEIAPSLHADRVE